MLAAVDMGTENYAFIVDLTQFGEAVKVDNAAIGENRPAQFMNYASHPFSRWWECWVEDIMIGIGQNHPHTYIFNILRRQSFHRALRTTGHNTGVGITRAGG